MLWGHLESLVYEIPLETSGTVTSGRILAAYEIGGAPERGTSLQCLQCSHLPPLQIAPVNQLKVILLTLPHKMPTNKHCEHETKSVNKVLIAEVES